MEQTSKPSSLGQPWATKCRFSLAFFLVSLLSEISQSGRFVNDCPHSLGQTMWALNLLDKGLFSGSRLSLHYDILDLGHLQFSPQRHQSKDALRRGRPAPSSPARAVNPARDGRLSNTHQIHCIIILSATPCCGGNRSKQRGRPAPGCPRDSAHTWKRARGQQGSIYRWEGGVV